MNKALIVLAIALCACSEPRGGERFGPCSVSNDGSTRSQAAQPLERIAPTAAYFLDVDAGGPLTCNPGPGECAACIGGDIELPIGAQTTVVIEIQNTSPIKATVLDLAIGPVTADRLDEVVLLAPLPDEVDASFGFAELFVGIAPTSTERLSATILVTLDAENQANRQTGREGAYAITLNVLGVE